MAHANDAFLKCWQ